MENQGSLQVTPFYALSTKSVHRHEFLGVQHTASAWEEKQKRPHLKFQEGLVLEPLQVQKPPRIRTLVVRRLLPLHPSLWSPRGPADWDLSMAVAATQVFPT